MKQFARRLAAALPMLLAALPGLLSGLLPSLMSGLLYGLLPASAAAQAPAAANTQAQGGTVVWPDRSAAIDPGDCRAVMAAQPRRLGLTHENDFVRHTDRGYTSGILISETIGRFEAVASNPCAGRWTRSMAAWLNRLPDASLTERTFAFSLGQQLFTPEDPKPSSVITTDRPYAGWLFGRWSLDARNASRSQTLALDLGMVGPAAFGEASQNFFHRIEGYPKFQGWRNQLRNEFAGQLTGEWRQVLWQGAAVTPLHRPTFAAAADVPRAGAAGNLYGQASAGNGRGAAGGSMVQAAPLSARNSEPSSPYRASLIGHFGVALGTIETYVNTGLQWRYGPSSSRELSLPATMRSGATLRPVVAANEYAGLQLFANLDVRAVARNMFIDGNLRGTSHSVERRPVVAEFSVGLAWRWAWADLIYAHTLRTREFVGQTYNPVYGSLTVGANLN